jgi:hypothetical protein
VTESSVPDDEGIEDSEATPGIEDSRPISNDEDYGNIEGTTEEGDINTDSYDPLMEGGLDVIYKCLQTNINMKNIMIKIWNI